VDGQNAVTLTVEGSGKYRYIYSNH